MSNILSFCSTLVYSTFIAELHDGCWKSNNKCLYSIVVYFMALIEMLYFFSAVFMSSVLDQTNTNAIWGGSVIFRSSNVCCNFKHWNDTFNSVTYNGQGPA